MTKVLILLTHIFLFGVSPELKKMREEFSLVNKEERAVDALRSLSLASRDVAPNIKTAYYAAAEMCSAQYKFNPASKIAVFNKGKELLEQACNMDTSAIETRYIRFTIQQNAPGFLGYNKQLNLDRAFVVARTAALRDKDPQLYAMIYAYLLAKVKLTEKEKQMLR